MKNIFLVITAQKGQIVGNPVIVRSTYVVGIKTDYFAIISKAKDLKTARQIVKEGKEQYKNLNFYIYSWNQINKYAYYRSTKE